LTNIESGETVGSIVECTRGAAGGATEFLQLFELPGGSLVSQGLGATATSLQPPPSDPVLGDAVVTVLIGIRPEPDENTLLEKTGRFQNVRWDQVRLSGFLNVFLAPGPTLDVDCIFVIDLYRGRP